MIGELSIVWLVLIAWLVLISNLKFVVHIATSISYVELDNSVLKT